MGAKHCPADLKIVTNWKNVLTPFRTTALLPGAFFGSIPSSFQQWLAISHNSQICSKYHFRALC